MREKVQMHSKRLKMLKDQKQRLDVYMTANRRLFKTSSHVIQHETYTFLLLGNQRHSPTYRVLTQFIDHKIAHLR